MGLMNSINDVSANFFRNNDLFTFENKAIFNKFISERKNNTELHEEGRLCILAILIAWCMSMHFMPTSSSAASLIFLIFASDLYMKLIWSVSKTLVFSHLYPKLANMICSRYLLYIFLHFSCTLFDTPTSGISIAFAEVSLVQQQYSFLGLSPEAWSLIQFWYGVQRCSSQTLH